MPTAKKENKTKVSTVKSKEKTSKTKAEQSPKASTSSTVDSTKEKDASKKSASKRVAKKSASEKSTAKLQPLNSSKFAVVDVNGEQIIVQEGGLYEVKRLSGDKGDEISLEKVLLISERGEIKIGKPYVEKASISVVIDSQKKDKKLRVFKYKAKSRYRRTYGSRALVTRLRVLSING